uniref:Deltameth_res domain-containing protein n=1 Tax=Meloidogyne hapla TaxID=6305 RepID=A0A1I8BP00_MELHA
MLDLGESSYANVGHDDNITPVFTPQHQAHIEDRRRKRSVAKIFLGENKRQKRMYDPSGYYHDPSGYNPSGSYYETSTSEHAGPSMTPPRSSQLTVTECGHWLAPIWFGFNLMLFILGWMLLAIQYYPMFA